MRSFAKGGILRLVTVLLMLAGAVLSAFPGFAGQERYDYDGLGRLIRLIDEQNRGTEYVYDAVGNLRQVIAGTQVAQPMTVSSVSPGLFRQGDIKTVTVSGSNLSGASVTPSDPALDITGLQASATQITFTLTVPVSATVGPATLKIASAAGIVNAAITVAPTLPKIQVSPTPLAIPPDNVQRQFTLRLSNADSIDHTIALAASNGSIVVTPASVTIPAGQTSVSAGIKGVSAGQSSLLLSSSTLGNTAVPVFVTTEFVGLSTSYAAALGVVRQVEAGSGTGLSVTPLVSRPLGIVIGSHLTGVAPAVLAQGSGATNLTISGAGLEGAQSIAVVPASGLLLGSLSVAPDGKSVTVPLTVSADAPLGMLRIVLKNAAGVAYPAASSEADRINIVRLPPEILSIDPLFGIAGSLQTLTIRGRNLQETLAVKIDPDNAIAIDSQPQVNADGTLLTVRVALAPTVALGTHTVQVLTPGGASGGTATSANTFTVVNEVQGSITPIVSPALGVLVQGSGATPAGTRDAFSRPLGVAVGAVATGIAPNVGIIGQTVNLSVQGDGLGGVNTVQLQPSTGLTVGAPSVAADGKSLTLTVTIDPAAPQTPRTLRLLAGTVVIPFALPEASIFQVAAPVPQLDSVMPNYLQTSLAPISLTVRGSNLQGATAVRLVPADGVSIFNPPVVNAGGTGLTVNASVAAGAATGPRALVVTTAGGDSSSLPTAFNTVTVTSNPGSMVTPVISGLLGVTVGNGSVTPPSSDIGPIVSAVLGVTVGQPVVTNPPLFVAGPGLGLVLGPVATGIEPDAFAPGSSGLLVVRGYALGSVSGVSSNPAAGITLGTPAIATDGSSITVPIDVAVDAAPIIREVVINGAGGRVPFSNAATNSFKIGPGVPRFDSISPILANQGDRITMTLRGANFTGATAVIATPPDGIRISTTPTIDSNGTLITVDIQIEANAPLGSRVIQVLVPGAASAEAASPMNTFTVFAP